jgi:REP element-mobilizing transposase RayT
MAIAFFSTWTTYGTWLPGDPRGWYQSGRGLQEPDALRRFEAALLMTEEALILDMDQRRLVEKTIADHCLIRKWIMHSVNCRSNHVHVAVTAPDRSIELPREQFKAWSTRRLKNLEQARGSSVVRENWWSERGWDVYFDDEDALANVNDYILDGQGSQPW